MDLRKLQADFQFPADYSLGWSTQVEIPESSIDELGHVTAAHYAELFEESGLRFTRHMWNIENPSYVTAQAHIHYRRELLLSYSPITVYVSPSDFSQSTFDLTMVIVGPGHEPCAVAQNHYVAWDRNGRHRRDLDNAELQAVQTAML